MVELTVTYLLPTRLLIRRTEQAVLTTLVIAVRKASVFTIFYILVVIFENSHDADFALSLCRGNLASKRNCDLHKAVEALTAARNVEQDDRAAIAIRKCHPIRRESLISAVLSVYGIERGPRIVSCNSDLPHRTLRASSGESLTCQTFRSIYPCYVRIPKTSVSSMCR
ncbi:hypothetical protein GGS20DRAFT_372387 [Poronia punctata]|nr:hypothetical protein GGS20DRAFT_372387 [Poronia punctata]